MRILIISLQGIGNTLMTLYAAEMLKDNSNAEISFVVSNNGSHKLVLSQLSENDVYIWDETKSSFRNIVRLTREIRKTYFDEVYLAYPSWKREGVIGLIARSVGKKVVLDSEGDWKYLRNFFKTKIKKTSNIHDINTNYLLFKVSNNGYLCSGKALIKTVKAYHDDYAQKYFTENSLQNKFVIAVHPGSKGEGKRWDAQKFMELCKDLNNRFDCKFIIIGGDDELLLKQTVANGIGGSAVLLNFSNLFQTASVLSKCNLFIGNDSAPMHLSVVMGTPVVALWSYTDFYRTSPYGPGNIIVRKSYPCSPCYGFTEDYINNCVHDLKCIKDLQVENVLPVISRFIEIITSNKQNVNTTDIDAINIPGLERVYRLEHGCTVVEFRG